MNKLYFLPTLLVIAAACSSSAAMNLHAYSQIDLGESSDQVVSTVGKPYAITQKGDGVVEYEYIERIKAGGRELEDRHYYLTIKDGKVINKRVVYGSPAPYLYDSYEMQTSQSDHPSPADE